jgi:hypothetical protein
VQCASGEVATGGGGKNGSGDHYTTSAPVNALGNVITSGKPTGWLYENANDKETITVYAICVK